MLVLFRITLLILSFLLFAEHDIEADQKKHGNGNPSQYVKDSVWKTVREYMIPDDLPIRNDLDTIFSSSRVLCDRTSLEAAGFEATLPQHRTQMIVAKHPKLSGYVIKAYFDDQPYYEDRPEHFYWIRRIKGARLIRNYIHSHHYDSLFKVPKKWLYLLPDEPSPPPHFLRKKFILVEEDMELFDEKMNEKLWGSDQVTKKLLYTLYKITTDLGLLDSAKPSNCSFSIDGKAAFIDTELYRRRIVKFEKLTPFLSTEMRAYWKKTTRHRQNTTFKQHKR